MMAKDPNYAKKKSTLYREKNPIKHLEAYRKWYRKGTNKEKRLADLKIWKAKNPDKVRATQIKSRQRNRAIAAKRSSDWRAKNPERNKQMLRDWWQNNPEKRAEYQSRPHVKIIRIARSRINTILKQLKIKKLKNTHAIIGGCTGEFFMQFIESQFTPEMNWGNHGSYWELDHTIPIVSFDVSIESELLKAFHYSNCKPLKKFDNRSKGNKMPKPNQALMI